MYSQFTILVMLAVAILAAAAGPPETGFLKDYGPLARYVFPFTATQCEPFYIFYNTSVPVAPFAFEDSPVTHAFLVLDVPIGIGYMEWICNVPAGLAFDVNIPLNYVVQPGSSSACLKDVTATYSLLSYVTAAYASYTRTASPPSAVTTTNVLPISTFPTGTFSTITLNSDLATTTPSPGPTSPAPPAPPAPPTPSPSPTPSPGPPIAAIAGGVVGAVAFVILILALVYVFWWRRRFSVPTSPPSPFDPQPVVFPGLATSEVGSSHPSSRLPFSAGRSSGAEFYGSTPQYPLSPSDYSTSDSGPTGVVSNVGTSSPHALPAYQPLPSEGSRTSRYAPSWSPYVDQRISQGAISPLEQQPVHLSPPRGSSVGYDGSLPSAPPSETSRASQTADQRTSNTLSSDTSSNANLKRSQPDAMPRFQQSSTSETQGGSFDLPTVLGVISRAQLNPREREVITSFNNLLLQNSSAPPDPARQEDPTSAPPPYSG